MMPVQIARHHRVHWLPPLLGLVTLLIYWWIWGALLPQARHFDESAYILQARILAQGSWTAPARPLPEFFQQFHVLVTPVLAAKYPPGHPLVMSIGEALKFPALVPLLLNGITGALVFVLAARIAGPMAGLITWLLWLLAPMNLSFRPSFLSNVTTSGLWILGWWGLLNWWDRRSRGGLLLLAGCVGWCIITRPLTGLVFALTSGPVVLRRTWQCRLWKDLGLATALGIVLIAVLPLANERTTGHWLHLPWTAYARQYTPYDRLGFGFDSTPPLHRPNPEMIRYMGLMHAVRRRHSLDALPTNTQRRIRSILEGIGGRASAILLLFTAVGLVSLPRQAILGLAAAGTLVLVHLAYPHPPTWIVYYLETVPVVAFVAAVGIRRLLSLRQSSDHFRLAGLVIASGSAILFAGLVVSLAQGLPRARHRKLLAAAPHAAFAEQLRGVAASKVIIFVRHDRRHAVSQSLIMNEPDLQRARVWVVHDRGPENARLRSIAPDRVSYLYDQAHDTLILLGPPDRGGP
jgi:hypothetical protein